MSSSEATFPNTTFDGGVLEINADKIEARLHTIWQQASAGFHADMPIAKLCLSNMIVVTDEKGHTDAEQLTSDLAAGYPSRVLLIAIVEDSEQYSAFVRTSCIRERETGIIRCWEVVELKIGEPYLDRLPGALRSLLVGSVPVVSIDFRDYQTTPQLDAIVMELSDRYFVNADIVPVDSLKRTYLPFRWYRTLTIRELLGELMGRVCAADCTVHPVRFETFVAEEYDTYSDLLCGWLVHRMRGEDLHQHGNSIALKHGQFGVTIDLLPWEDIDQTLRVQFNNGEMGRIRKAGATEEGYTIYQATYKDIVIERSSHAVPLGRYIVETLHDRSEFEEFAATNAALDKLAEQQP